MSRCFAKGCNLSVDKSMLMCHEHWDQVPKHIRDEVWRTYRVKQRKGGAIYPDYNRAIMAARRSLAT